MIFVPGNFYDRPRVYIYTYTVTFAIFVNSVFSVHRGLGKRSATCQRDLLLLQCTPEGREREDFVVAQT